MRTFRAVITLHQLLTVTGVWVSAVTQERLERDTEHQNSPGFIYNTNIVGKQLKIKAVQTPAQRCSH